MIRITRRTCGFRIRRNPTDHLHIRTIKGGQHASRRKPSTVDPPVGMATLFTRGPQMRKPVIHNTPRIPRAIVGCRAGDRNHNLLALPDQGRARRHLCNFRTRRRRLRSAPSSKSIIPRHRSVSADPLQRTTTAFSSEPPPHVCPKRRGTSAVTLVRRVADRRCACAKTTQAIL